MGISNKSWIEKVSISSNDFEKSNSDIKRKYLIRNIYAFNYITSLVSVNLGSFGTGYPFYTLKKDLTGKLPIISEQIRYNNELIKQAENSNKSEWICDGCLSQNYQDMPDLKQVCKPCPNMDNVLKPRKVINRLPDLDMWMICKDGHIEDAQCELAELLSKFNINPSDIDPLQTIQDVEEIAENIKNGIMPKKFLPVDAHIIEYSKIKNLINQVPATLEKAKNSGQVPYLPIHPKSYRKIWQYDDEAYNFIYDFLSAFSEFNFTYELNQVLKNSRDIVANKYSPEQLHTFLLESATESNRKRIESTEALSKIFFDRVKSWKTRDEINNSDELDER